MEAQVEEIIKQYQLTSRSKKLRNLNIKNTKKIAKSIDSSKFKKLLSKRTQTINDLYLYLDKSIKDGALDKTNLDSQFITNKYLAEKYLREYIIHSEEKRSIIKEMILRHKTYQQEMQTKRQAITDTQALKVLDREIWDACETYETQAILQFQNLKLPFFTLNEHYHYQQLNDDKKWLLQKLNELLTNG